MTPVLGQCLLLSFCKLPSKKFTVGIICCHDKFSSIDINGYILNMSGNGLSIIFELAVKQNILDLEFFLINNRSREKTCLRDSRAGKTQPRMPSKEIC